MSWDFFLVTSKIHGKWEYKELSLIGPHPGTDVLGRNWTSRLIGFRRKTSWNNWGVFYAHYRINRGVSCIIRQPHVPVNYQSQNQFRPTNTNCILNKMCNLLMAWKVIFNTKHFYNNLQLHCCFQFHQSATNSNPADATNQATIIRFVRFSASD